MSDWYVYLIRTRDNSLYTGIATDVARRLAEHEGNGRTGAKYLQSKGPLKLEFQTRIGDQSLALKAEHCIKRMSKMNKEKIVEVKPEGPELLALLRLGTTKTSL